jgi:hypothetical protein
MRSCHHSIGASVRHTSKSFVRRIGRAPPESARGSLLCMLRPLLKPCKRVQTFRTDGNSMCTCTARKCAAFIRVRNSSVLWQCLQRELAYTLKDNIWTCGALSKLPISCRNRLQALGLKLRIDQLIFSPQIDHMNRCSTLMAHINQTSQHNGSSRQGDCISRNDQSEGCCVRY